MKNHMISKAVQSFQEKVANAIGHKIALGTTLALFVFGGMLGGVAGAQSATTDFVPFGSFIDKTSNADANDYMARPASKVQDAASFEEMRQHILNMYQGVEVNHSFVLGSAHYDCIPECSNLPSGSTGCRRLLHHRRSQRSLNQPTAVTPTPPGARRYRMKRTRSTHSATPLIARNIPSPSAGSRWRRRPAFQPSSSFSRRAKMNTFRRTRNITHRVERRISIPPRSRTWTTTAAIRC